MTPLRALLAGVAVVAVVVAAGLLLNKDLNDRYRWLCEAKGHLWVQPTHGDPYCGDGTGNPATE
ncbi:MAG: hypothetical protein M3N53_06490 [Actinomycetota bacterium]|nr:hypothetical protein [Actinomycetota bacterium]